jgi:hypothetical protein
VTRAAPRRAPLRRWEWRLVAPTQGAPRFRTRTVRWDPGRPSLATCRSAQSDPKGDVRRQQSNGGERRIADVAGHGLGRLNWAESARTGVVSIRSGSRAKTAIQLRTRKIQTSFALREVALPRARRPTDWRRCHHEEAAGDSCRGGRARLQEHTITCPDSLISPPGRREHRLRRRPRNRKTRPSVTGDTRVIFCSVDLCHNSGTPMRLPFLRAP